MLSKKGKIKVIIDNGNMIILTSGITITFSGIDIILT